MEISLHTLRKMLNYKVWFALFLLFSFINFNNFRVQHFQEPDSQIVYSLIEDYPQGQLFLTNSLYPSSESIVKKIRLSTIQLLDKNRIPPIIRSAGGLAIGSTYSPLTGLLYKLANINTNNRQLFINNCITLNLFFFHLSAWLLFIIIYNIHKRYSVAICCALIYLFAYTNYNYAYHLGNYIWNSIYIITGIYLFQKKYKNQFLTSTLIGIMCTGSYFMVVFWVAYFLYCLFYNYKKTTTIKLIITQFKNHFTGGILILSTLALFYIPNQGMRGGLILVLDYPKIIMYLMLNCTAFIAEEGIIKYSQFVGALALFTVATYYVAKYKYRNIITSQLGVFMLLYWGLLAILVLFRLLSVVPSRHFIFLSPILLLYLSFGLHFLLPSKFISLFTIIGIMVMGILSFNLQKSSLTRLDNAAELYANGDYYKQETQYLNKIFLSKYFIAITTDSVPKDSIITLENQFNLVTLLQYKYIDSTTYLKYKITYEKEKITDKYFLAYNLYHYSFDWANNLYIQTLKKIKD